MAQATIDTTVSGIQGVPVSSTPPTAGQILIFNGTAWVPGSSINGPLSASGVLTGGSVNTAGAVTAGSVNAASAAITNALTAGSAQTPGNPGTFLNGAGVNIVTGRGYGSKNFLSTIYQTTGSQSRAGGADCSVIPRTSGLLLVCGSCQISNDTANGQANVGLAAGVGTPPAQGTAIDAGSGGIQALGYGASISNNGNTAGVWVPWSIIMPWGGFVIGTSYWFDIMVSVPNNVGTASVAWGNMWVAEL